MEASGFCKYPEFIDLIYRRYSDPEKMIESQLSAGTLQEYFLFILQQEKKEKQERKLWELYLKIADKTELSFEQWREEVISGR